MNIIVTPKPQGQPHEGILRYGELTLNCALGKNGVISAQNKREGDGCTPLGSWPLRRIFYRSDKIPHLQNALPITCDMGWCDAPEHPAYNTLVTLPFAASHELMWRDNDDCYDIVIELGYNDAPPIAGKGSAIFFHCTGGSHTEGCVAIAKDAMLALLPKLEAGVMMEIRKA